MTKNKKVAETGNANAAAIITGVVTVVVAIIGCFSAVAVAGIQPFAGYLLNLQPDTATPPSVEKVYPITSVPYTAGAGVAVATDSPVAFSLPGEDWAQNCIDANIWKPYLSGENRQAMSSCYQLSEWGINADKGELVLASNQSQSRAVEYGILTPWQGWTEFDFTARAKHLENSEIWIAFLAGDSLDSQGVVFVIQPGDVVDIRDTPPEHPIVDNIYLRYAEGTFHPHVVFDGGRLAVSVDGQGIVSEWPINFTVKNLFVGYRSLPSTNLDASISGLKFIK